MKKFCTTRSNAQKKNRSRVDEFVVVGRRSSVVCRFFWRFDTNLETFTEFLLNVSVSFSNLVVRFLKSFTIWRQAPKGRN